MPPLRESEVATLVGPEAGALVPELRLWSAGNPLSLHAYISLLEQGHSLPLDPDQALQLDTELRIRRLSPAAKLLLTDVIVLSDPLPTSALGEMTGIPEAEVEAAFEELRSRGLMSGRWFHERRRAAILALLNPEHRAAASRRAATTIWDLMPTLPDASWLVELVHQVRQAPEIGDVSGQVAAVMELGTDELAVLGAAVELGSTSETLSIVPGEVLLTYARATFHSEGDLAVAVESLEERDLIETLERGRLVGVISRLEDLPRALVEGRLIEEVGVRPVPALATTALREVLGPEIGEHLAASLGIGIPTMRELSYSAQEIEPSFMHSPGHDERRASRPALGLRAHFGGRPIHGAFSFGDRPSRDRAAARVSGLRRELLGSEIEVTRTLSLPQLAVPSERFLVAAEVILNKGLRPQSTAGGAVRELLHEQIDEQERYARRLATRSAVRELSSDIERAANTTELPLQISWSEADNAWLEVEVLGAEEGASENPALAMVSPADRWGFFRISEALNLPPNALISSVTVAAWPDREHDPVLEELGRLSFQAFRFNQTQLPLPVYFDDRLFKLLGEAHRRRLTDARALAQVIPFAGEIDREIGPRTLYLAIALIEDDLEGTSGWVPGVRGHAVWAETTSPGAEDEVHVARVTANRKALLGERGTEIFLENPKSFPGFDPDKFLRGGYSSGANSLLAHLLGYREADLDFMAGLRE